jgi:outer membrane protein assembly factor BamB
VELSGIFRSAGAVLACIAISACSARLTQADATALPIAPPDWPVYQYSSDRNAVFHNADLHAQWTFDAKAQINGGLALAHGLVLFETFKKNVIALDARTGELRWRTGQFRNILMTTPIVANGLVYVGTGANPVLDMHHNMFRALQYRNKEVLGVPQGDEIAALSLVDGTKRWSFETMGENMPSPAYYQGRLIFANGDWHAYALRGDNGKLLWTSDVNGLSAMSNAAINGSRIIFGICANGIWKSSTVALDANTGKVVWEAPYGHCDGSPAIGDGKVFVESVQPGPMKYVGRNRVAALDASTGKVLWTYLAPADGVATSLGSSEGSIAGMYHDGVYYQAFPLDDRFIAFSARTGRVLWSIKTAAPVKMSAVIDRGVVYFGDTAGVLYSVDSASGKLQNVRLFKGPFTTTPPIIIGHTMLFVNDTKVYAVPT